MRANVVTGALLASAALLMGLPASSADAVPSPAATPEAAASPAVADGERKATRVTVKLPDRVTFREDFDVRIKVAATTGGPAAGYVNLMDPGPTGTVFEPSGHLKFGRTTIKVRRNFGPGRHVVKAQYLGSGKLRPSNVKFVLIVERRSR